MNKSAAGFGPFVVSSDYEMTLLDLPECDESLSQTTFKSNDMTTVLDISQHLKVVHVAEQQVFSVSSATGTTHSVRLFPVETCTCPVGTTCCHILAAKRSIGMPPNQQRCVNLGQLRRNSCKRADKKSGSKQPRRGDVSFVEAPDSSVAAEVSVNTSKFEDHVLC